jgi:fermentation-respiration switch protein FrsA (DUF1100 family)
MGKSWNPNFIDSGAIDMIERRKAFIVTLLIFSLALFVLYLSACTYVWTQQDKYIYMPQRLITSTPADYRLPFKDTFIFVKEQSNASERLHAWFIPSPEKSNKSVLLYLHGSALNIGANIDHARRFRNMGFSVLLLSYRGYGISDGDSPSEKNIYADAEAAWAYLTTVKGVAPHSIFIYGHSLGGAVAIQLAATHPNAGGLIVEGTFTSIAEMAQLYPQYQILPLNLIINQRFDSEKKVKNLQVPVLYIHGTKDKRVPFEMSYKLYSQTSSAKRIKLIMGGGHNNSAAVGGEEYLNSVKDFICFARSLRPSISKGITDSVSMTQLCQTN